jgi:hypothetical protein
MNDAAFTTMRLEETREALVEVEHEVARAVAKFPPMHSAHEAYAVILEELDELWDEVKKKQRDRDRSLLRKEAMQVAAMAIRFMTDVTGER